MAVAHLTAAEAAARLGVKRETLYAYVSRGQLGRTMSLDGRSSLFDPGEIDALRTSRRRSASGELSTVIASSVTQLDEAAGHRYRTPDGPVAAVELLDRSFSEVADLIWGGPADPDAWTLPAPTAALVRSLVGALPDDAPPLDRLRIAVSAVSASDPARHARATAVQTQAARHMIGAMVVALGGDRDRSIAAALWSALSPHPCTPAAEAALDAVLILLADHGLATSTFAVRVAASVRADPYSMVSAGLGAVGGRIHGAASGYVHRFFVDAERDGLTAAIGQRLDAGQHLPGMGHAVYRRADVRKVALERLVFAAHDGDDRLTLVRAAEERFAAYEQGPANIDFALGALTWLAGMEPWAGEALFAISRTVGWVAHGIEELREPALRFRPVARYVAPREPLPEDGHP